MHHTPESSHPLGEYSCTIPPPPLRSTRLSERSRPGSLYCCSITPPAIVEYTHEMSRSNSNEMKHGHSIRPDDRRKVNKYQVRMDSHDLGLRCFGSYPSPEVAWPFADRQLVARYLRTGTSPLPLNQPQHFRTYYIEEANRLLADLQSRPANERGQTTYWFLFHDPKLEIDYTHTEPCLSESKVTTKLLSFKVADVAEETESDTTSETTSDRERMLISVGFSARGTLFLCLVSFSFRVYCLVFLQTHMQTSTDVLEATIQRDSGRGECASHPAAPPPAGGSSSNSLHGVSSYDRLIVYQR